MEKIQQMVNGITPASAEHLFTSGVDVITTGNYTFRRKESYDLFTAKTVCCALPIIQRGSR